MASGHLIGGILELWRSAAALWNGRPRERAAPEAAEPLAPRERARILAEARLTQKDLTEMLRASYARGDLLVRGMDSLGVDADDFYARYTLRHHDMERACAGCPARSRCRRDLATGDFARRYRHYCPNAASLSEIAARAAPAGRA